MVSNSVEFVDVAVEMFANILPKMGKYKRKEKKKKKRKKRKEVIGKG